MNNDSGYDQVVSPGGILEDEDIQVACPPPEKRMVKKRKRCDGRVAARIADRVDVVVWYCLACGRCEAWKEHSRYSPWSDSWTSFSGRKLKEPGKALARLGCTEERVEDLLRRSRCGNWCDTCYLKAEFRLSRS